VPELLAVRVRQIGISGIAGYTHSQTVPVPTGVELPGESGPPPSQSDQLATRGNIIAAGGGEVLVLRIMNDNVAPDPVYYVSSGTTLTEQTTWGTGLPWPLTGFGHVFLSFTLAGTHWYYAANGWTAADLIATSMPSDFSAEPTAYAGATPLGVPLGGSVYAAPHVVGTDGSTVYALLSEFPNIRLYSCATFPEWADQGLIQRDGTDSPSDPVLPIVSYRPAWLFKATAAWLLITPAGVWRTTEAVPLTAWKRVPAVSRTNLYTAPYPFTHTASLVDGARVYLGGFDQFGAVYLSISSDSGATWTTTAITGWTAPPAQIVKTGTTVVAIREDGGAVRTNPGSGTTWTAAATSGLGPIQDNVSHRARTDGTRAWVLETVSASAQTWRVKVSADGITWTDPVFA
jgi:hypothetical protein